MSADTSPAAEPSTPPDATPSKEPRRAASTFILATVIIDSMGFGLVMPVMPSLLMELTQSDVGTAARWGGLATFVFAIMQFLFSPVIGGLSDRFGRRPVLLMSLTALAIDYVLMGLAHALWVFFIARTLAGVFAATHSTANAYITDTTSADQRAKHFGYLGAAFGAGFVLGPALGGLLGELSPRAPFYAAAALAGVNALYGFFVVPESLPKERRRPFEWKRANTFATIMKLGHTKELGVLAVVYFFANLSTIVYPVAWTYVAIAKFGWSDGQLGLSMAYYGVIFVISQAVLVPILLPRLGERRAIWVSLAVEAVSLVGIAFAPSSIWVYVWISLALISGVQGPALQKVLTQAVPPDAQGELQGGLAALGGVTLVLAPLLYTQLFFAFETGMFGVRFPGAPFLLAAAFSTMAMVLFLSRRERPAPTEHETPVER